MQLRNVKRCFIFIGAVAAEYYGWIVTVVSVMANGKVEKDGKIELKRLQQALYMAHCEFTIQEIAEVAKILDCLEAKDNNFIYYNELLQPIAVSFRPPDLPGKEEGKSPQKVAPQEATPSQEGKSPVSPAEDKKEVPEEPLENPTDPEKSKIEIALPELPDTWCDGEFSIVINRCHDCQAHESYSRHSEEVMRFLHLIRNS